MNRVLSLRKLDAFYGLTQVLFGIDLELEAGAITTLLGANGAGKTTMLRAISRTVRTQGEIVFGDHELSRLRTEQVARLGIAHVPDGRGTFAVLSVEENLRLGAYARQDRHEIELDIERAYERFPKLKERRTQQAGTLSGGEQQMLAISRALMLRPKVLLLDEPSFGLAPLVVEDIFRRITDIVGSEQVSVLLVEQNAHLALAASRYAYVIESGKIILSGSATLVGGDAAVRRSYLGA